jgi:hypothetical protein
MHAGALTDSSRMFMIAGIAVVLLVLFTCCFFSLIIILRSLMGPRRMRGMHEAVPYLRTDVSFTTLDAFQSDAEMLPDLPEHLRRSRGSMQRVAEVEEEDEAPHVVMVVMPDSSMTLGQACTAVAPNAPALSGLLKGYQQEDTAVSAPVAHAGVVDALWPLAQTEPVVAPRVQDAAAEQRMLVASDTNGSSSGTVASAIFENVESPYFLQLPRAGRGPSGRHPVRFQRRRERERPRHASEHIFGGSRGASRSSEDSNARPAAAGRVGHVSVVHDVAHDDASVARVDESSMGHNTQGAAREVAPRVGTGVAQGAVERQPGSPAAVIASCGEPAAVSGSSRQQQPGSPAAGSGSWESIHSARERPGRGPGAWEQDLGAASTYRTI